jgi:hypothetical protein
MNAEYRMLHSIGSVRTYKVGPWSNDFDPELFFHLFDLKQREMPKGLCFLVLFPINSQMTLRLCGSAQGRKWTLG